VNEYVPLSANFAWNTIVGYYYQPMSAPAAPVAIPDAATTSPLDRVVTLFGIPIPLRELGARCTRSFCIEGREDAHPEHNALACQLVTEALRRRWSMPDLDLATHQLSYADDGTVYDIISHCYSVCFICCQVYMGQLRALPTLDAYVNSVEARFALLPNRLPYVNCVPFSPIRWNSETPLPRLLAIGLQQHIYRVQLPQQVAFLLGEPLQLFYNLYSGLVYGRSGRTPSWSDDQQKSARAVWSRVCTVRYPGIVTIVAEVFPVVGLPELVAEYVVGVVCADGSRE
jgi:hypothetical protein